MEQRIKELKEERKKLNEWLWTLGKAYGNEEDNEFKKKEEAEAEKQLEINRQELFKLTGHAKYHDNEAIRNQWSRLHFLLEEIVVGQLCDLEEDELDKIYEKYIAKAEEPEKYQLYRFGSMDNSMKLSLLMSLISNVKIEEFWKASRV